MNIQNFDPYDPENPINKINTNTEKAYGYIDNSMNQLDNNIVSTELEEKLSKCNIEDVPEFSLNGIKTKGKVVDIYDGDSCKVILLNGITLMRFNCRLKFIDTPEMKPSKNKPNREMEIQNAIKCRNKLLQLTTSCNVNIDDNLTKLQMKKLMRLNNKVITIKCHEFDKYGRLLVELFVNDKTANNILVEEGFAKSYDGGTKDVFVY
jgi:endonuclease YncB( thermonuclease family)